MADVTVHVLRQIDVAEAIDLDAVRALAGGAPLPKAARVTRDELPAPGVVPARTPVDLYLEDVTVGPFVAKARLRVFEFGVAALRFSIARPGLDGPELVRLGTDVAAQAAAFDAEARRLWHEVAPALSSTMTPGDPALSGKLLEDFTVFVLSGMPVEEAADARLVHLLLGEPESRQLSPAFCRSIFDQGIRYYADDLMLMAWDAAVIIEPAGALDTVNVLEMASAQLLEVRYYDAVVRRATAALTADAAKARTNFWLVRSPFASLGRRAAVLALELSEITDRLENAITLVGDSWTVTVYREAAKRFRLVESRQAVREDIETLAAVSETFGSDVHSRRSIVLELAIIALILIEVLRAC